MYDVPLLPFMGYMLMDSPARALRRTLCRHTVTLPPVNYLTLHYVYFLGTCLVCSMIFYYSSTPFRSVGFADALFMCVSAMTGAGLNTVGGFYSLRSAGTWAR